MECFWWIQVSWIEWISGPRTDGWTHERHSPLLHRHGQVHCYAATLTRNLVPLPACCIRHKKTQCELPWVTFPFLTARSLSYSLGPVNLSWLPLGAALLVAQFMAESETDSVFSVSFSFQNVLPSASPSWCLQNLSPTGEASGSYESEPPHPKIDVSMTLLLSPVSVRHYHNIWINRRI